MKMKIVEYDRHSKTITFKVGDRVISGDLTVMENGQATIRPNDEERKGQPPFIVVVQTEADLKVGSTHLLT